ncbi:MAG TPA: efflux RND transporter periplasmic adaptor subunit [Myxococcales bacterium]|nr:efflux RND transporter periplasmic adaptor subunit [Myxococcales bacterium]
MKGRRIVVVLVAVAAIAAVAIFVYRRTSQKRAAAESNTAAQAAARAVQVVVANVQKRDVPIYLDGLGSVTAFKTVTVRSQVDGRLDQVLFKEGQAVKTGELLAKIDPRPFQNQLQQARGALERDKAQLDGAKRNLERYKQLAAKKLIPQQQADDQAATVGQFEGAVRVDQATIGVALLNLDYANIKSPLDGVTGIRLVDPGNLVHASDANGLVVITQLDPIAVLFSLPQDELPRVMQELQKTTLAVEAWNRDGSQKLATGQLSLVDNQVNAATATIRLKSAFPNPQRLLWPNLFVKARLLLTVRKDALVVPSTVPQRGPDGTFAYVVQPDQTVQPHNIEIEHNEGDIAVIAKGLSEGETVVVDGQNQLRAGSKVIPRQAGQPVRAQREGEVPRADSPRPPRGPRQ